MIELLVKEGTEQFVEAVVDVSFDCGTGDLLNQLAGQGHHIGLRVAPAG